jgi:transglutaminase-like putative cysteine protease
MHPRRLAILILGLLGAAVALVWAALELKQPPSPEDLEKWTGTEWYQVRILGEAAGYACAQTELVPTPQGPRLRITEDVKVLISLAGQQLEASKSQVTRYDELLRLVELELVKNELGRTTELVARLDGRELQISKTAAGTTEQRTETVSDDFASDLIISLRAARGQLKVGDEFNFEAYEPDLDILDRRRVQVERQEKLADGTPVLVIRARSEKLGVEAVTWLDEQGGMQRQTMPGLMELTLERVTEEEALAEVTPLEIVSKIPVQGRLPSPRGLREVRLRIKRKVGSALDLIPVTPRQRVDAENDDVLITVTAEEPGTKGTTFAVGDDATGEFLEPTSIAQSDDPRLVERARSIVGDETDAWQAATRLLRWVHDNMKKVSSEPRPITALECLESMSGDCTEHAILLAALARAAGLRSKLCTGLAYVGGGFGYHAWNEIYVGRWVEMDPAWGQVAVDASHLQLFSGSLDAASMARNSLATGRTMGTIEISLLGYLTEDGENVELTEH